MAPTRPPLSTVPRGDRARLRMLHVSLIGFLSGGLYLFVYLAQRDLYHMTFDGMYLRGVATDRSPLPVECAIYYAATIALFVLYVRLLTLCRRGQIRDRRSRALALVFPVLFNLGLLFGRPYLSIDLYSYIGFGYLGSIPGGNPNLQ